MRVLLFGASGMVGQGVLREALGDPSVEAISSVVRRPSDRPDPRVREIVLPELAAIGTIVDELPAFDAVLYCAGVSAAGLSEAEYTRQTYDLTVTVATVLAGRNPASTFIYVSGAGTDSSERGRFMWARVKGRTENALRRLPFGASYAVRPGFIQPLHGVSSRTGWYRALYALVQPVAPVLLRLFPGLVTTTERLGRAMLRVAASGFPRAILETRDINALG